AMASTTTSAAMNVFIVFLLLLPNASLNLMPKAAKRSDTTLQNPESRIQNPESRIRGQFT
ncbi:MAG: hypothetical protein KDJ38_13850, partial [Gammaproteobacteria bacterium]|nr:hypothetical protein [Gammaproteobacteria bacterium]